MNMKKINKKSKIKFAKVLLKALDLERDYKNPEAFLEDLRMLKYLPITLIILFVIITISTLV